MDRSWDYYDDIAHLYDSQYEEPYWKLYHLITEKLLEDVIGQNHLRSPLKVLDLGSGTGYWMEYFVERGDDVYCLEPSDKMIEIIKMKSEVLEKRINIYRGICEKLPYEDETFELINAQGDVFSYSMNAEEGLKEAFRVLKPGGMITGSVDNFYAFLNDALCVGDIERVNTLQETPYTEIGNSEVSDKKFKTRLYTPDSLKNILNVSGFENIQIGGKVVFGLYEEADLIEEMDSISEIEVKYCFCKDLIGKAEHLHFSAKKPINV